MGKQLFTLVTCMSMTRKIVEEKSAADRGLLAVGVLVAGDGWGQEVQDAKGRLGPEVQAAQDYCVQ